jgi:hypothetical protein
MFAMLSDVGLKSFPLAKIDPLSKGLKYRLRTDDRVFKTLPIEFRNGQTAFVSISRNLKIKVRSKKKC